MYIVLIFWSDPLNGSWDISRQRALRSGRAGPGRVGPGRVGPGQIRDKGIFWFVMTNKDVWHSFFVKNRKFFLTQWPLGETLSLRSIVKSLKAIEHLEMFHNLYRKKYIQVPICNYLIVPGCCIWAQCSKVKIRKPRVPIPPLHRHSSNFLRNKYNKILIDLIHF